MTLSDPRRQLTAVTLGAFWALLLCTICRQAILEYFPVADEWAILAHSLPGLAEPVQWLTSGFAGYLEPYPGHTVPSGFMRPLFNLAYWLYATVFDPFSGSFLLVNYLAIGICSATVYLCMTHDRACPPGQAAVLALLLPLMPSLAGEPGSLTLLQPMMAYDAVAAALSLAAWLTFEQQRYAATAMLLAIALMTKESSLPVAIAFPLAQLWARRRELYEARRSLLILALPVVSWALWRTVAFGNPLSGTYVLSRPEGPLWALTAGLTRMPMYAPLPLVALDFWSAQAAKVWANATIGIAVAVMLARRWTATRSWHAADLTLIIAVPFFALVGRETPRFGVVMHAFLFLVASRSGVDPIERIARAAVIGLLAVSGAFYGLSFATRWPASESHALQAYGVSRQYAQALQSLGSQPVLVLNDPVTPFSSPALVAAALRLPPAERWKASDFPQIFFGFRPPCHSSIDEQPGAIELRQSCGFMLWGVMPRASLPLAADLRATFPRAAPSAVDAGPWRWGDVLRVETSRHGLAVLWFDPDRVAIRKTEVP